MNVPENNPQGLPHSMDENEVVERLRRQVNLIFGALIVSSLTLALFLGVQAREITIQDNVVKNNVNEFGRAVQQDTLNVGATFTKLAEFARTHPDFQKQVLTNYVVNIQKSSPAPEK